MTDATADSAPGEHAEASPDEFGNPLERLKLLAGDDDRISRYLDSLEVSSPREREMLREIARTRPLADLGAFPTAHRNASEALESLARHGYRGTRAGRRLGPLRPVARWGVQLVARYVVVSYVRHVSTSLRNLYGMREIQALPGTTARRELSRARADAERMVDALQQRELGLPTFLLGGAILPIVASVGSATGFLANETVATVIGIVGTLLALAASWFVLRGAAMASRRIHLAAQGPLLALWNAVGWCGRPPRDQSRTFAILAVALTLGAWVIVPTLLGIALAT